jgi:DNA-binding response OmpR family regulator
MQPIRILLIGDTLNLMRRLKFRLEVQGYEVTLGCGAPSPAFSLSRVRPDVLIAELAAGDGRIETWRRGIESYRMRRSLSVLFLADERAGKGERLLAAEAADLGIVEKPQRARKVIERLETWYEAENSTLLAG